jgi:hypothetical protein
MRNFGEQLTIINDDILNIDENSLFDEKVIVFGNFTLQHIHRNIKQMDNKLKR